MLQQQDAAEAPRAFTVTDPGTRLTLLRERRDMIADQYQSVMAERGRVGQERLNAQARGDAGMVREYDAAVERLGARLKSLEQSLQKAEQELDQAMRAPISVVPGAPLPPDAVEAPPPVETVTLLPGMEFEPALQAQRSEFLRYMALEGVVLLMIGAVLWRFGVAKGRRSAAEERQRQPIDTARTDDRLQQAVDAIAIEVERLSEGQRFLSNLLSARKPERDALPLPPRTGTTPNDGTRITPH